MISDIRCGFKDILEACFQSRASHRRLRSSEKKEKVHIKMASWGLFIYFENCIFHELFPTERRRWLIRNVMCTLNYQMSIDLTSPADATLIFFLLKFRSLRSKSISWWLCFALLPTWFESVDEVVADSGPLSTYALDTTYKIINASRTLSSSLLEMSIGIRKLINHWPKHTHVFNPFVISLSGLVFL